MSEETPSGLNRRRFVQGMGLAASAAVPLAAQVVVSAQEPPVGSTPPPTGSSLRPLRPPTFKAQSAVTAASLPPVNVIALNRMAFGPRPGDLAAIKALGSSDEERLFAYIDQQLAPESISDVELDARMAEAGFTTLAKTRAELWDEHIVNHGGDYSVRTLPAREVERAAFVRAMYSKRQLVEVLADFWHNHFNTYAWEYPLYAMFAYYDRDVIRGNMLGNFRQMLQDVAESTCMLYYLDNYTNSRAGPNENWARELLELHAMGAENYMGVRRQSDVPLDGQGRPAGYVDDDVYEATRCFTGWTVANSDSSPGGNTGLLLYRDDWHDRFQKTVLGQFIPADQEPFKDGLDVLDVLAAHPGTGRHICRKLCRRLISDDPPESVVQSAAVLFTAQKDAADQLKQVVRHILRSPEFRLTWGQKVKRPFEAVVSAMRAADADFTIKLDDGDSNSFMSYYGYIGQPLFRWPAPDGYPDIKEAWQSTTPLVMRWRIFGWLIDVKDDDEEFRLDVLDQTPASIRSPNALADFWLDRILGRVVDAGTRQQIAEFMAQGRNPDYDLALDTDGDVQDRLRAMVALIMMSPDFQWR